MTLDTATAPATSSNQPSTSIEPVQKHSVHTLVFRSLKRSAEMFLTDHYNLPPVDEESDKLYRSVKAKMEYGDGIIKETERIAKRGNAATNPLALPEPPQEPSIDPTTGTVTMSGSKQQKLAITAGPLHEKPPGEKRTDQQLIEAATPTDARGMYDNVKAMLPRRAPMIKKPTWHAPWKLYRVISGHTGWVRCVDVEPGNEWFATGGGDRIVKIWDLATGSLKLSLTGHVSTVRGVKVSARQPYLFTVAEDKTVKCWDLEYNKVIRHYHGHLSAVYAIDLHPTIDILCTGGRDGAVRVWDMRTMAQIFALSGHTSTIGAIRCQSAEPQVISGSHDSTVRLWDLAAGKSRVTLTHHKKSIRSLALHPRLYMFASGAPDNIKQWKCPDGEYVQNMAGHNAIINALAVNEDGVVVSGGDNGSMQFWDWGSAVCFQKIQSKPQPGSIDSESGIFGLTFDQSHTRLISAEADKTIKMYKEDPEATEETHPVLWRPEVLKKKQW